MEPSSHHRQLAKVLNKNRNPSRQRIGEELRGNWCALCNYPKTQFWQGEGHQTSNN